MDGQQASIDGRRAAVSSGVWRRASRERHAPALALACMLLSGRRLFGVTFYAKLK
jgi:hypothetical protein